MMGSTYNYTTNVAEMFVIDITDGTTTTLSSPPGSWVLGINPVDISKYTYYDSTTYDTYYTDGIHTSNI